MKGARDRFARRPSRSMSIAAPCPQAASDRDAVAQRTTHTTHLPGTTEPPGVSVAGPSGAAPGGGRALGGDAGAGAGAAGAGARGFATAFLCLAI